VVQLKNLPVFRWVPLMAQVYSPTYAHSGGFFIFVPLIWKNRDAFLDGDRSAANDFSVRFLFSFELIGAGGGRAPECYLIEWSADASAWTRRLLCV
jgi:drug/metabolite transporter superfamily protein YnfA